MAKFSPQDAFKPLILMEHIEVSFIYQYFQRLSGNRGELQHSYNLSLSPSEIS